MPKLTASLIFNGYSDYWRGQSGRGQEGGCAFAYYGPDTTLRDLVDQWVDDAWSNDYDFEGLPEDTSREDIRDCIVRSLTAEGRRDYDSGALCEWAADCEDDRTCKDCHERIGELHGEDCPYYEEDEDYEVEAMDCDDCDDCIESPQAILWIEWEKCPDCDNYTGEDTCDGLCDPCYDKHYGEGDNCDG